MRILVLTPTCREHDNMLAALDKAAATANDYTGVRCGIGKACAAASTSRALCSAAEKFDMIAVVGYAASAAGRRQGEVVMPSSARYHDCIIPDGFIPEMTDPYALQGCDDDVVFTGDSFVDGRIIGEVKRRFGCERALFDMEITAVCQTAEMMGRVPVVAVKMVSDVPECGDTEHSYDEFADSHTDFSVFVDRLERLAADRR
ncbi:MAG: hypothetical protein K2O07_06110 [Alistipes sp.]|nr:hypothetical protein [Alistipes sp.]